MNNRTTEYSNGRSQTRPADYNQRPNMKGHLGDLGADLITLGELQLELVAVDARDAAQQAVLPAVLVSLGVGFLFGVCPLALLGFSWWLADSTELGRVASSFIVAGAGLAVALMLFLIAWNGFKKSAALLNRSRAELRSNLEWVKKLISQKQRYRQRTE